jgi:hypothetical protein
MRKTILITLGIILLITATGCTNRKDAERALTAQGFKNITYTGYDFFGCSEDDFYHTGFKAKNTEGIPVSGTVCSGLFFKNATIRF